jgi:hypothetical protein
MNSLKPNNLTPTTAKSPRYEIAFDIVNTWLVWDEVEDGPAWFAGESLIGLSKLKALQFAKILNETYDRASV